MEYILRFITAIFVNNIVLSQFLDTPRNGQIPKNCANTMLFTNIDVYKRQVLVGFDKEGNIIDYSLLSHAETPGLGSKAADWFKKEMCIRDRYPRIVTTQCCSQI